MSKFSSRTSLFAIQAALLHKIENTVVIFLAWFVRPVHVSRFLFFPVALRDELRVLHDPARVLFALEDGAHLPLLVSTLLWAIGGGGDGSSERHDHHHRRAVSVGSGLVAESMDLTRSRPVLVATGVTYDPRNDSARRSCGLRRVSLHFRCTEALYAERFVFALL